MIKETGTVISVEEDALWVETNQRSSCQSCAAEKGCGQGLIARASSKTMKIRVLLDSSNQDRFYPNDRVLIGIPAGVVVSGTLMLYLLPLLTLVTGVLIGYSWSGGDGATALGGLLGLITGGLLVRLHTLRYRHDKRVHPVVLKRLPLAEGHV